MTSTELRGPDQLPALDTMAPEFTANPSDAYRTALRSDWAARTWRGVEILSYDACEAVLLDDRFRSGVVKLIEFMGLDAMVAMVGTGRSMLASEGDDHRLLRSTLSPWFTPKRVGELRVATIELVDRLLDEVEADGACEYVETIARVVPGVVFCWMVGAPPSDGVQLSRWSETLLKSFAANPDDAPAIKSANADLDDYIHDLIATKRANPGSDLTSMLVAAEQSGRIRSDDVVTLLHEILSASTDNTTHSSAIQLYLLANHPDQWDLVARDPNLVAAAVEECGRYEPRLGSTPVLNVDEVEFRGLVLPAGSISWAVVAAAHHDPAAFPEPERFDILRPSPRTQLSFGVGRHYCLGANLARMELRVMMERLIERWERPELGDGVRTDRISGMSIHSLPVTFRPRR